MMAFLFYSDLAATFQLPSHCGIIYGDANNLQEIRKEARDLLSSRVGGAQLLDLLLEKNILTLKELVVAAGLLQQPLWREGTALSVLLQSLLLGLSHSRSRKAGSGLFGLHALLGAKLQSLDLLLIMD
jgi:hypothetical protein